MGKKKQEERPVLAVIREESGDSRAEMAERLGVSAHHVGQVERGIYPIGKGMSRKLLDQYQRAMKRGGIDAEALIRA